MKILNIDPDSPLFGYVRPGYRVLSVNGNQIEDAIDFRYKTTDEQVKIVFADPNGRMLDFDFEDIFADDLGLTLDDGKVRVCKNDCIFCFIRQQPQGMRRALYIKDEDYRLSFTHGNFVTLSNTTDDDIARIIEQRLSPLYVSVHATDDKLRRCMLRNEKLAPIIPRLKQLAEGGITIHTQVVLCPEINDGEQMDKTINDLAGLYPSVETLAVVPVGLTRYREHLAKLRPYNPDEAARIVDHVESIQRKLLREVGTRFVWAADEFYVAAQRDFPRLSEYEEMSQFENGIGMVREFLTRFNRRKRHLKGLNKSKRALFLTGHSSYPFFNKEFMPALTKEMGLQINLVPVTNFFWGETVTVSGLLTGQDLLREARKRQDEFDIVVLPPNCLNNDDLFLDNLTLDQFSAALGKPVAIGQYDLAATLKEVFQ
ncbi:MAG: DUF512 domain-containing protein [bacterium]|nr:DUF512 domain-containing protein [bacterium]